MKKVKRLVIGILIISLSVPEVKSQTYFKVDITSGNVWVGFATIGASYFINKPKGEFLVDNYLTMNAFPANVHDDNSRMYITSNTDKFDVVTQRRDKL